MLQLINDILDDILWPAVLVMALWVVFLFNYAYQWGLLQYGIHPGEVSGLIGVFASPFLHVNFQHIFSNSVPFLVSGAFIFHFYNKVAWKVLVIIWFFSGFGVWLLATPGANHVGASGVVYGMVAFLLTSGIIRKNRALMAVALILVFLYGSMVWGIFPQYDPTSHEQISWQGHLAGALTGIILAFIYRHRGPDDDSYFEDEDDDGDDDDEDVFYNRDYFEQEDRKINYHYRRDSDPEYDDDLN